MSNQLYGGSFLEETGAPTAQQWRARRNERDYYRRFIDGSSPPTLDDEHVDLYVNLIQAADHMTRCEESSPGWPVDYSQGANYD